jgi:mannose-6-phosphate isomerase-like protein (cupin superfamily)
MEVFVMGKNYSIMKIGTFKGDLADKKRIMAGEKLGLTGTEISLNYATVGKFAPFAHSHKLNEEVYIILSGKGVFMVDDEEFPIQEGNLIRVSPKGERAIKAEDDMVYICIQAQKGSLTQATKDDGVITQSKASWMKDQ